MESPFATITQAFKPDYCVNFSVERPDGSVLLTLSCDEQVAVKRFISAEQWQDPERLQRFIASVQMGLAIENGELPTPRLQSASAGRSRD